MVEIYQLLGFFFFKVNIVVLFIYYNTIYQLLMIYIYIYIYGVFHLGSTLISLSLVYTRTAELPTITISAESLRFSVLSAHCITSLVCLYFGEYTQAVACSAQPLWCSSHGSCSGPHGLKAFAASVNRNGAFFQKSPDFVGMMCFTHAEDHLFRTMFPDTEIAKKYGSGQGPEKSVVRTPDTCGFCLRGSEQSKTF